MNILWATIMVLQYLLNSGNIDYQVYRDPELKKLLFLPTVRDTSWIEPVWVPYDTVMMDGERVILMKPKEHEEKYWYYRE